jgi:phage terminase large subunit-like protein
LSPDSCMHRLRELGLSGEDPRFYFREYAAPAGADITDEEVWAACNPALGDFLSIDALRSTLKTTRPEAFRRFRLNEMVMDAGSWLEWGQWEALGHPRALVPGEKIVLGFDGSVSGDSTALVASTLGPTPYLSLQGLWEAPSGPPGRTGWSVPRHEVTDALAALFARFEVVELACDPFYWRDTVAEWELRWPGRVIEYPTHTVQRMAPATDRAYAAIAEGRLSHDGNPDMARHFRNCVVRSTPAGDCVSKDHKNSPRRIDAAIAAIVALDRAAFYLHQPVRRFRVGAF